MNRFIATIEDARAKYTNWGMQTGPCFVRIGADGKKESSPCNANGDRAALTDVIGMPVPDGDGYGIFGLLGEEGGGFVCFDFDKKHFVDDHSEASSSYYLNKAVTTVVDVLGETYQERTPSGGKHLIYRCPDIAALGGSYKLFGPGGDRWGELLGLGGARAVYMAPTMPTGSDSGYVTEVSLSPAVITSLDGLNVSGNNDAGTVSCDGVWLELLYKHFAPDDDDVVGILELTDFDSLVPLRTKQVLKGKRDYRDRSAELSFLVRSLCGWSEFLKQAGFIIHPQAAEVIVTELGEYLGYGSAELDRKATWVVNHCIAKADCGEPPQPYHPNQGRNLPEHLVRKPAEQIVWIRDGAKRSILARRLKAIGIDVPTRRPTSEETQARNAEIRAHLGLNSPKTSWEFGS